MSLALIDVRESRWQEAQQRLVRAKEAFARLGQFRLYVISTLNLGFQRLWSGHLEAAERDLREATRLAGEMGDPRIECTGHMDHGLALTRLGRHEDARRELSAALRLCRRQASPRRLAIALEYTAEFHLATGAVRRAGRLLDRALRIANRIAPDGDIVPELVRRKSEVALAEGGPEEALRLAGEAIRLADRLGDSYEKATALRAEGQALLALSRVQEAEHSLKSALAVLEDLGEIYERDKVQRLLDPRSHAARARSHHRKSPGPATEELKSLLETYGMVGSSPAMLDLMRQTRLIAPTQLPVLIQGETGTGKELLARAVHGMAGRPSRPFVAFNCATCPSDLLDAELFGYRKGAFTGAASDRAGLVRSSRGGSLFLDEIGELPDASQARFLRMLDSGEVRPLGSDEAVRVDVRIIAATHVDLEERVRLGRFRSDLYFRLAGVRLSIPPLRDRSGDIRELIARFIEEARRTVAAGFAGLSEDSIQAMERFDWPGNVRQLRLEVMRQAALSEPGHPVDCWSGPGEAKGARVRAKEAGEILGDAQRLTRFLALHSGKVSLAAEALGVSKGQLYKVMKRLHVKSGLPGPPTT